MEVGVTYSEIESLLDTVSEERRQSRILQGMLDSRMTAGLITDPNAYRSCRQKLEELERSALFKQDFLEQLRADFKVAGKKIDIELGVLREKVSELDV